MLADSTRFPFSAVVYINDTIAGEGWQGSGVLIAPDEVLTASHVVYSSDNGAAYDITVTPGYNAGSRPYSTATATAVHYFQIQDPGDYITTQQSQIDYAVIHLSTSFPDLGTMALEPDFPDGWVNVTGYPAVANGQLVTQSEYVTHDPVTSVYDGTSIGSGSSGGPVWVSSSDGSADVVGLVSSAQAGPGSAGYFTQITAAAYDQIEAWVADDHGTVQAGPALAVLDTTTGQSLPASVQPYTGPLDFLQDQYLNLGADSLNITATTPGWFIHGGAGNDAIAVTAGRNVLDGGTGSNFLTGGSGADTFFVDDRGPPSDIWSTVVNFHAGDVATVWGITPGSFSLAWAAGEGARGYTGLTLHATQAGAPTASLTLAGFRQADLANGRLSVSYGTDAASGSPYMYIVANA